MNWAEELRRGKMGGTPRVCQAALAEWAAKLMDGKQYGAPGGKRAVKVYEQELPIPEESDTDADTQDAPPPFIIVRVEGGEIKDDVSPQIVECNLVLCAYDGSRARTGWMDVANMRESIIQELCEYPYFGGVFTVLKPIKWAMQQDDTHPYYYGVVSFNCTTPALTQDAALKELL